MPKRETNYAGFCFVLAILMALMIVAYQYGRHVATREIRQGTGTEYRGPMPMPSTAAIDEARTKAVAGREE